MGLDGVEIVMGVEEFLGIDIPNADAQRILTPGMPAIRLQRSAGALSTAPNVRA